MSRRWRTRSAFPLSTADDTDDLYGRRSRVSRRDCAWDPAQHPPGRGRGTHDCDDDRENQQRDPEADPLLPPRLSRLDDGLFGMFQPGLHVGIDLLRVVLDHGERLVLLFDEHGHFVEHLRELGQGLFDLLDVVISLLNLAEGAPGVTVSVRV